MVDPSASAGKDHLRPGGRRCAQGRALMIEDVRPQPDPLQKSRSDDLRRWRAQFEDSVPIDQAQPRTSVICVGVVRALRLVPGRALEVTIEDGSGRLTAFFTGRARLPGLEMSSALRLVGTLTEDSHGRQMRNPNWTLISEPYA